jgi:hypothetical protein
VKLEVESVAELAALKEVLAGQSQATPATLEDLGGDRSLQCLHANAGALCTLPKGHTGHHCAVGYGGGVTW